MKIISKTSLRVSTSLLWYWSTTQTRDDLYSKRTLKSKRNELFAERILFIRRRKYMCASSHYHTCSCPPPILLLVRWQYAQHWSTVSCLSYSLLVGHKSLGGFWNTNINWIL